MAGEINYYQVFDVAREAPPAEGAPDRAGDEASREVSAVESEGFTAKSADFAAKSADFAARANKKGGRLEGEKAAGESGKGGRVQSDEENAHFAARRRERERRNSLASMARAPKEPGAAVLPAGAGQAEKGGALRRDSKRADTRPGRETPPGQAPGAPQGFVAEAGEKFSGGPAVPPIIPAASETHETPGRPGPEQPEPEQPGLEPTQPQVGSGALEEQFAQLQRNAQMLQQAEAAARTERDYAVDRSIRMRIESEVAEIGRLDPSVRSFEDIRNSPDYARLGELVKGGVSLVDAYKLTHFDRLTQNAAAGARQAALNARSGKAHLQRMDGTGGEAPPAVPGEVLRAYRAIMPELSTREIEQHYNQYLEG